MKQRTVLTIIIILLTLLAIFQLALSLGAPWGAAAWGGQYEVLSGGLRIASGISVFVYLLMIWVARKRVTKPKARGFRIGTWIIAGFFCLAVIPNLFSPSYLERFWAPICLFLAWAFFSLARANKP